VEGVVVMVEVVVEEEAKYHRGGFVAILIDNYAVAILFL